MGEDEPESIVGQLTFVKSKRNNLQFVRVRWSGYGSNVDTLEPFDDWKGKPLYNEFLQKLSKSALSIVTSEATSKIETGCISDFFMWKPLSVTFRGPSGEQIPMIMNTKVSLLPSTCYLLPVIAEKPHNTSIAQYRHSTAQHLPALPTPSRPRR
jgi:hypothetical protein